MKIQALAPLLATAILAVSVGYASAADVKKGKRVFNKCKACHSLVAGKKGIGPSLHGVFGRTAGTLEKYKYSKAMKAAGAGGKVWNEETITAYLANPKKYIKGNKMAFAGLKKKSDQENIIAFLKEATK